MGIGYHSGHAVRQNRPGELSGGHQGTLDMHMRVDEARTHIASCQIDLLPCLVSRSQTYHPRTGDGDIGWVDLTAEDVNQLDILE